VGERGFEGLQAWQKARELMIAVHKKVMPLLPPEEKWDLTHQIRSSSKSVTANIAEGYGRYYYGEVRALADQARRLLNGYINYVKRRRQGENEPGSDLVIREVRATYSTADLTLVNSLPRSPVDTSQGDNQ